MSAEGGMTDHARRVLRDIGALQRAARGLLGEHRQVCAEAGAAATPLRRRAAREWLRSVPVARLKQVADGPFRLGPVHGADVFGPLTGGTPEARRQEIVDAYAAELGHAVLLAAIPAAGPGARDASVVILCEPQKDPDVEARAIGGAYGAGRTGTVRVHRLPAPGTVDAWVGEGPG